MWSPTDYDGGTVRGIAASAYEWVRRRRSQDLYRLDRQHGVTVAQSLAVARLVLALLAFIAVTLDPPEPPLLPAAVFLVPLLNLFLVYSLSILFAALARPLGVLRRGPLLHLADLAWSVAVTVVSGGANSPFVAFFAYTLLAAGYRWGLAATLGTGLFAMLTVVAEAGLNLVWPFAHPVHLSAVMMRVTYLALGAALLGLLAEGERRQRFRSLAVTRILSHVRVESGLVASVRAVFGELLSHLSAPRGLLVLEEEGSDQLFLWKAERPASGDKLEVRLRQEPRAVGGTYMFPVPPTADVLKIRRRRDAGELDIVALDGDGIRQPPRGVLAAQLLTTPFTWKIALCVSRLSSEGWNGRVFVFDPRRAGVHDLQFLQVVARQIAPALFNLYLQRRLRSRSGVAERMRISRELHDGTIQSLIGLEMELEVLRRETDPSLPATTRDRLAEIQRVLGQEILNVRDLMQRLKPIEVEPSRFPEHLAEALERFRHRTGIQTRLVCEVDEVDLPARTCRELAGVLEEALANVRKHSGASNVLVRMGATDGAWRLEIDDDGKGFDFEGLLEQVELDRWHRGPVIIKERVRAIGGRLAVHSQPGHGSRLEITIPR